MGRQWHTVDEEYDCLGLASILGLGDIGVQPIDLFNSAFWLALCYFARKAAGRHSNAGRHCGWYERMSV